MNFCPPADFEESLFKLLSKTVLEETALRDFYSHWRSLERDGVVSRKVNIRPKSIIAAVQKVPENVDLRGVDLPAWMNGGKIEHKIMIVGQDPLRTDASFDNEWARANKEEMVIVSTPFAAHLQFQLPKNPTALKFQRMVSSLIAQNVLVYFTDLYKTFFRLGEKSGIQFKERKKDKVHRDLLLHEIQLIAPDLIVVLGNVALGALYEMYEPRSEERNGFVHYFEALEIPVLHLIHPADYGRQRSFFKENFSPVHGEVKNHEEAIWQALQQI